LIYPVRHCPKTGRWQFAAAMKKTFRPSSARMSTPTLMTCMALLMFGLYGTEAVSLHGGGAAANLAQDAILDGLEGTVDVYARAQKAKTFLVEQNLSGPFNLQIWFSDAFIGLDDNASQIISNASTPGQTLFAEITQSGRALIQAEIKYNKTQTATKVKILVIDTNKVGLLDCLQQFCTVADTLAKGTEFDVSRDNREKWSFCNNTHCLGLDQNQLLLKPKKDKLLITKKSPHPDQMCSKVTCSKAGESKVDDVTASCLVCNQICTEKDCCKVEAERNKANAKTTDASSKEDDASAQSSGKPVSEASANKTDASSKEDDASAQSSGNFVLAAIVALAAAILVLAAFLHCR